MSASATGGRRTGDGGRSRAGPLRFSPTELRDLAAAWLVLSVAFALFFYGPGILASAPTIVAGVLATMLVTVGTGFLLHELAHKVVAVRFGQIAEFRADYSMLFIAVMGGLIGFIFAAPGAVHHRGYISDREHGLIALAGPVTNLVLAAAFVPILLLAPSLGAGLVGGYSAGQLGVGINLLLAAFNMIPFGPLDGRTVLDWNKGVFALVFVPSVVLALWIFFF